MCSVNLPKAHITREAHITSGGHITFRCAEHIVRREFFGTLGVDSAEIMKYNFISNTGRPGGVPEADFRRRK